MINDLSKQNKEFISVMEKHKLIQHNEDVLDGLKQQLAGISKQYYETKSQMQQIANRSAIYVDNRTFIDWISENAGEIDSDHYESQKEWDSSSYDWESSSLDC